MIKIQFCRSPKIGSRFICWGLEEPVSHVVFEFQYYHICYHSHLVGGVQRMTLTQRDRDYIIVREIEMGSTHPGQEREMINAFNAVLRSSWDYRAGLYFAWRAILKKFFKRPYPRLNLGDRYGAMMCTECFYIVGDLFAKWFGKVILFEDRSLGMITPWELYSKLLQHFSPSPSQSAVKR